MATTTVLDSILAIFDGVSDWLVSAMGAIEPLFFAEGSLTFLGVLAVAGLAISVVWMLIGVVQKFLHFAG